MAHSIRKRANPLQNENTKKKIKLETIEVDNGEYELIIVRNLSLDYELPQNTKIKQKLSADEDDDEYYYLDSVFNSDSELDSSQIVPDYIGPNRESILSPPSDAKATDDAEMIVFFDFYDKDIANVLPKAEVDQIHPTEPFELPYGCDSSSESENLLDEWQNDDPKDEFKPAKCLKCSRKVYDIQDCPRHDTRV